MQSCARLLAWLSILSVSTAASVASAHPQVDEARGRYEEADFEAALEHLAEAESGGELTREDYLELLRLRALVHLGIGEIEAVEADLDRLLSLEPDYELGATVPPEVTEAAARIRERLEAPLEVEARLEATDTGAEVTAEVHHDRSGLVQRVDVVSRGDGAAWQRKPPPVAVSADVASFDYYAEAIGPGGAVLARDGSESDPLHWSAPPPPAAPEPVPDQDGPPWLWMGVGAGAAVVLTTVVAVAVAAGGGSSDSSRPTAPMIVR